jgi:tetratricopeptide (TPR) repeat protein
MDLLDSILGTSGCNVDGSISRNPLTQFIDSVFDNPMLSGGSNQDGDFGSDQQMNYYSAVAANRQLMAQQSQQGQFSNEALNSLDMATHFDNENAPMLGAGMSLPFMPPQHMMMGMGSQGFFPPPAFMMQHMGQMGNPYFAQQNAQAMEHINEEQYKEDSADYEEEEYDTVQRGGQEGSTMMSTQQSDAIIDDSVEARLNRIVQGHADQHQLEADGPSLEGYQRAWDDLSTKLATGVVDASANEYVFSQDNAFLQEERVASQESVEDLFKDAMELYRQGKVNRAIQAFEAVVQTRQNSNDLDEQENDECWRMLGICHAENDEDRKAIICLNRSIECDPYNLDTLLALGTSYVNELDSQSALDTLKAWVMHNPRFQGLDVAQDAYSDGTLMDEVMQLILSVAALAPGDKDVLTILGVLYNVSSDYEEAIDCFRKALETQPDDYSLHNKLAATCANSSRSSEALPIYAGALRIRPSYVRGWLNLGISFANLGKYEEAAKAYVQALHLNPMAKHICGCLKVALNCSEKEVLRSLIDCEDTEQIAKALNVDLMDA